jgi:hypothetical protein
MNLTPTGFGIIVAILLIVAVIVVVAENLHDRHEDELEYPWPMRLRDTCDLESCCEPSVVEFAGGNGPLYICAIHAGPVSAWAPVVGVRMPYDQDGVA